MTQSHRLPEERWNGIRTYPPMEIGVDKWTDIMAMRLAHPLNDYDNVDPSLLPLLAWQNGAVAFDPGGTEEQQRLALKNARRLSLAQGSDLAFDILCESNGVVGFLRDVGDYDSAGTLVPREGVTDRDRRRMQGGYSLHSTDPMVEDKVREGAQGRYIGYPGEQETDNFRRLYWDGLTYRKYLAIDIELPPNRGSDLAFAHFIAQAAAKTVSYTREVVEVNIAARFQFNASELIHVDNFTAFWLDMRQE